MPFGNTSFDTILTTSLRNRRKSLEDAVFNAFPLFYYLNEAGRKDVRDGGYELLYPLMGGKNLTAGSYSKYQTLDTAAQEGITSAVYSWRQYAATVAISRLELRQNAGPHKVLDILDAKIFQAMESLKDIMNADALRNSKTNSTDVEPLGDLVSSDEAGAAPGTDTVGGIDATDANNSWWRPTRANASSAFNSNGLIRMRTVYNSISRGSDYPDLVITTRSTFENYDRALAANERLSDEKSVGAGFQNFLYKSSIVYFDADMPANKMYFLNTKYLNLAVDRETSFYTTDFIEPANQDAMVAKILWMGNLTCSNRARQGVIDNTDTW